MGLKPLAGIDEDHDAHEQQDADVEENVKEGRSDTLEERDEEQLEVDAAEERPQSTVPGLSHGSDLGVPDVALKSMAGFQSRGWRHPIGKI